MNILIHILQILVIPLAVKFSQSLANFDRFLQDRNHNSTFLTSVTEHEIHEIIRNYSDKKNAGHDYIGSLAIFKPLTFIMNL